jgi:hypothetical protein
MYDNSHDRYLVGGYLAQSDAGSLRAAYGKCQFSSKQFSMSPLSSKHLR